LGSLVATDCSNVVVSLRRTPVAPAPEDDGVLVERARAGDERAFAQLYRRHARYVAGVVYRLMGDDLELDDVVQESFLSLRDQLAEIREPERVRFWVVRVAVRLAQRRLERRRRRFRLLSAQPPPATRTEPEIDDDLRALFDALATLSPDIRIPWTLHKIEGETLPRVAELCDISLATVKRRVAEAEQKLERRLHGR
jgi:RNA polymerase sigma-70 factor (ECF subfamily)